MQVSDDHGSCEGTKENAHAYSDTVMRKDDGEVSVPLFLVPGQFLFGRLVAFVSFIIPEEMG